VISIKIEGLSEMINKLSQEQWLNPDRIDAIVEQAAMPLVARLKADYSQKHGTSKSAEMRKLTLSLANSVEAFRRNRKKGEPYFTYYVGPRYSGGKNALISYGGNAAHLLEFGTAPRFRANTGKGGASVKGRVYGAKHSTGYVKPYGIIRKAYDEYKGAGIEFMKSKINSLIKEQAKLKGLQAA
jgi:hypothetical protein